jgi:hypothetical protein
MIIRTLVCILFFVSCDLIFASDPTGVFGKVHPAPVGVDNAGARAVSLVLKLSSLAAAKGGISYNSVGFAQEWEPAIPAGAGGSLKEAESFLRPTLAGLVGLCPESFLGRPDLYKFTLRLEPASPKTKDKGTATAGAGADSLGQ